MATNQEINLIIKVKGDLQKALAQANRELETLEGKGNKSGLSLAKNLKDSLRPANELIQAFRKVGFYASITIGAMALAMEDLKNKIKDVDTVANDFGISAGEMSNKMYGFDVATNSARIGVNNMKENMGALAKAGIWLEGVLAKLSGTAKVLQQAEIDKSLGGMSFNDASAEVLRKQRLANQYSPEVAPVRASMYRQMQQAELTATAFKKSQIDIQAKNFISFGIQENYVREWQRTQMISIEKEKTRELMKQEAIRLKATGNTVKAMQKEQELAYDAYADVWGDDGNIMKAFEEGQKAILAEAKKTALGITQFWQGTRQSFENTLSSMFSDSFRGEMKKAKDYFKDFALSVADEFSKMIAKMIAEMAIMGQKAESNGWIGTASKFITSAIMSWFGGGYGQGVNINAGGGGGYSGGAGGSSDWIGGNTISYHTGGRVRKAHSGYLATDEVPIIAQTGEAILSRRAVSRMGGLGVSRMNNGEGGGQGVQITIAPVITAWDASDIYRNRKQITDIIAQDIMNNGQMRKVIQTAGR
jgi:hypothetical protein